MNISDLLAKIEALTKELSSVKQELKRVKSELKSVRQQNTGLREQLAKHQNPKNSCNSSMPPSKDNNRPKPN